MKVHISDFLLSFQNSDLIWVIIPIFFIGIITDKYQEEYKTNVGNAISNGALIIFSGFSWLQLITSRGIFFPTEVTLSQALLSTFVILYGLTIVLSGFNLGKFAKKYGRIRVVTFMLMFITVIIHIPILYNYVSVILFVLLFPFYYAFITELIKVMPSIKGRKKKALKVKYYNYSKNNNYFDIFRSKVKEYLK